MWEISASRDATWGGGECRGKIPFSLYLEREKNTFPFFPGIVSSLWRIFLLLQDFFPQTPKMYFHDEVDNKSGYREASSRPLFKGSVSQDFLPLFFMIWTHPRCESHRGVHHTVESNCTPGSQNRKFCLPLVAFKETREKIWLIKCWFNKPKILTPRCVWHRSVIHTAESEFSNFMIEYLDEIKTEF